MSHNLIWKNKHLLVVFDNKLTLEEFLEVNSIVATDERFDSIVGVIADVTQISHFDLTEKDLVLASHVAKIFPKLNQNVKCFAYVVSHKFQEELIEKYILQYVHKEWARKVFSNYTDAEDWVLSYDN